MLSFRYSGILNGIDTEMWNPATDIYLPAKFDGNYFCDVVEVLRHHLLWATIAYVSPVWGMLMLV